ncbi:hypothetical protein [Reichenbachiella sp. 5M10]|uniref:hypothetical protein n=1 Tax=Reichenbachiella sp. 5M10 TaxID=1889772 RepID=UPI00117992D9|nr:hypothetical protein [Reichenbachiella sp. 5M10]
MKQLLFLILIIYWNSCYSQSTPELEELFLKADSVLMIDQGFEDEELIFPGELVNKGLSEFCYPEHPNFHITSQDKVLQLMTSLNFKSTEDALFCGFNYDIIGYFNGEIIYSFQLNSQCNYVLTSFGRYYISEFDNNEFLKTISPKRMKTCFFKSAELMERYIIDQRQSNSEALIEITINTSNGEFSVSTTRK